MKIYGQDCPVAQSLEVLGDRWTLLIVRDLFLGRTKFAEFQASLLGIPTNLLGDRLKQLEDGGIVVRRFYSEHPPRAEYVLTEKGKALDSVLGALSEWGVRFTETKPPPHRIHTTCGEPLRLRWYCTRCEEPAGRKMTIQPREIAAASH